MKNKQLLASQRTTDYSVMLERVVGLIDQARRTSARSVNAIMTATYWLIGWHIVEFEQKGKRRAEYGDALLKKMSADLTARCGKGYSLTNLKQFRQFYLSYSAAKKSQTLSDLLPNVQIEKGRSVSDQLVLQKFAPRFSLPWSAYVRLLSVKNEHAQHFYETEALRGGWSVRQLDRQINSLFYERTALSRNKTKILTQGSIAQPEDVLTPEEEIKDPYVLEFLDLKDEYSETDIEEALILHLERFLLELGGDFTFMGRQRRLRVGDEWYRIDLLFYHRRLRCLVIVDLKRGRFTHADAGQMHLYLNYARSHWMLPNENPPVGLILCSQKDEAIARYALENLPNKVLAAEYRMTLPDEKLIAAELEKTRRLLCVRKRRGPKRKEL